MATEKRLIDANALSENVSGIGKDLKRPRAVELACLVMINEAPTVEAVEVIRCKDCKHCDPENLHCDHPMGTTFPFRRKPDDFCSYGERKDND